MLTSCTEVQMMKMQNIPVPWNQFPGLFQKFQVLTKFNVAFRNVLFGDENASWF